MPHHERWEADGIVDREVWRKAGAAGLLGMDVDTDHGGGGQRDFRFNAVLLGWASRVRARASRAARSASIGSDFAPARRAGRYWRSSS